MRVLLTLALCSIIMHFFLFPYTLIAINFQVESSSFIIYQSSAYDPCSVVSKSISVNDYGFSEQGHFRILVNSSFNMNSSLINEIKRMAEDAYNSLVDFFNSTPYDQNKDGIIEILIANLNEAYNRGVFIAGYTIPGSDPNGKSIIYIDAHYLNSTSHIDIYITIAHELFHLIQASMFNLSNHADWVIEGTAVLASDYAIKGYSPLNESISFAYNSFNVSLLTPSACLSLSSYIANYVIAPIFFEFMAEKFGLNIIKKFMYELRSKDDIQALESVTNSTIDELFSQFSVWNFLGLYKGTDYTFENVKVRANTIATLGINSTYQNIVHAFSINYIELPSDSLVLYIDYKLASTLLTRNYPIKENLNFVIIKINSTSSYYEISYLKNEKIIYLSNNKNFDRIILAIVNSDTKDYVYSIYVKPSNITIITVTQTNTSYSSTETYLYIIILILSIVLLVIVALYLYSRISINKASFQGT